MNPRRRPSRRSSSLKPALLGGALTLGLATGGFWAYSAGHLEALGLSPSEVSAGDSELGSLGEDQVLVILASQSIPAYTKVGREHILLPGELRLRTQAVSSELAERDGLFTKVEEIRGRVLAKDKPAGYAFRERDFLPEGTRPGLVGGIPAGRRGLRVEAGRLLGIAGLLPGDRFDLVAAFPMPEAPVVRNPLGNRFTRGDSLAAQAFAELGPKARVEVLVHDGMIVEPLSVRQVPVSTSSLTQGLQVQTKPVEELVIALMPEEVGSLLEALALEMELTVLPRSGRPDDPDSRTPDHEPRSSDGEFGKETADEGFRYIERIDGSELQAIPVANG